MATKKTKKKAKKSTARTRKVSPKKRPVQSFKILRQEWLPIAGVLILTGVLFARAAGYDFVNWDDDFNISKNPNLRYFDWTNIKGIFTSGVIGNYNPLTTLSFAIEKAIFGLNPSAFHSTNIALHLLCTFLVYRLSRMLGLTMWPALGVAVLFGVHPLRIESVAWITERKDVLFGAFYLGALIQYVKWIKTKRKRKYLIWIIVLFALSLLSKIQAVALPLSMLAIDYLLKQKLNWRRIIEKIPFFAMSMLFGLLGIYFLSQQGSLDSTTQYNLLQRLMIGAYSLVIYVIKFFVPFQISPLYPYPATFGWYIYASVVPALAILGFAWYAWKKQWTPLVFGITLFLFNVMFVLQVVGAGQGFLADRFTYIPYVGLMFALCYYADVLYKSANRLGRFVPYISGVWIASLVAISWLHVPIWKDSATLWSHVLQYHEDTALPWRNRAQFYRDTKQFDLALNDYGRSIALKKDADVINSRARLYFEQQNWEKALEDYNLAIEVDATVGEYWINRGSTNAMRGDLQAALRDMTEGLRLEPDWENGYKSRSLVYQRLGRTDEALQDVIKYNEINPYDGDLWYEAGRLYRIKKQENQAIESFNRALQLGQKGPYYFERSKSYLAIGNKAQARQDLQRAEELGTAIDTKTRAAYQ